jgi:hypothetical protein
MSDAPPSHTAASIKAKDIADDAYNAIMDFGEEILRGMGYGDGEWQGP